MYGNYSNKYKKLTEEFPLLPWKLQLGWLTKENRFVVLISADEEDTIKVEQEMVK